MLQRILILAIVSASVSFCSSNKVVEETSSESETPKPEKVEKKDIWAWDYGSGARGPENWASLNAQYDMCSGGKMQSPINLVWHKPTGNSPLSISYNEGNATVINAGYTFRIELTPQSSIQFQGQDYLLEKIEFRSPSEHTLSGNQLPMELQFYHRSSNGLKQAVISLFVIHGRGSAWFDNLWEKSLNLPKFKSSKPFRFNPNQLIPPRQTFYHYEGSLTHPPCLEGVQWFVFNTPLQLSKEQVAMFKNYYEKNNRPVQEANGRKVINH